MKMIDRVLSLGHQAMGVWLVAAMFNSPQAGGGEASATHLEVAGEPVSGHGDPYVPLRGSPAPASELLEKGIYSEENKGDLEGAIKIYREVIAEAKGAQALAAQAQYRVGVCLYKQRSFAEASAAFEKLVREYPDQKGIVALANHYLAGAMALLPAPWADGEEMRFDVKFPTGFKLGMMSYAVQAAEANGRKTWRLVKRACAGGQSFSQVEVEADSFKPLRSRWKYPIIGDVEAVYAPGRAELKAKGKAEVSRVDLEGAVFDNEEVVQLMRRLPLAPGYATTLKCIVTLGGGAVMPFKLEVTGPESVETPAGKFECYKVELNIKQTFWYTTDARRLLVKFEAGGVIVELTGVNQRKAGEPVSYADPAFHIALAAPPDWDFYRQGPELAKAKAVLIILDPETMSSSQLVVQNTARLKAGARKSGRDWANSRITEDAKYLKNLEIRAESWQDRVVAGHPGLSYLGDYVEGQEKMISYGILSLDEKTATEFQFQLPAKDFEALRTKFDGIVESYRLD
jgi:hypothetical protein